MVGSDYNSDYLACDEIVDQVVEWIGRQWKQSMIKRSLREIDPNIQLKTIQKLLKLARQKIRDIYHADPNEFKGKAIEFYASVVRDPKYRIQFRLTAQQRLDALLGLEHVQTEDPALYAAKILAAMKQMDSSVKGDTVNIVNTEDSKSTDVNPDETQEMEEDKPVNEEELAEELKDAKFPVAMKGKS